MRAMQCARANLQEIGLQRALRLAVFDPSIEILLVLAVGAYLVINQESTAGIIIAGSILTARALAPVELAIANWKGFAGARQSAHRLDQLLKLLPSNNDAGKLQVADNFSYSFGKHDVKINCAAVDLDGDNFLCA